MLNACSVAYKNFEEYFARVEAFSTEIEAASHLKDTIKELARELALLQLVAMADVYRIDITTLLIQSNLEFLRQSREKIDYKDIVGLGNWEAVVGEMVRKEVEDFTSCSYGNWTEKLRAALLPNLVLNKLDVLMLEETIATRNLVAHRAGIVDQEYFRRAGAWYRASNIPHPALGTRREVTLKYYVGATTCLRRVIRAIDLEATKVLPTQHTTFV